MNRLVGLVIFFLWDSNTHFAFFSKCSPSEVKLQLADESEVWTVCCFSFLIPQHLY